MNINDALDIFYKHFIDVLDKHAPLREKRVKRNKQPEWMNEDNLQHMSQRDHYKEIGDEESYRASRNRTVEMIKQAKTEYYTNVIQQNKSNRKILWDYLRQMAPKDSKQLPSDGDTKLTGPQDIANSFNEFFTMIVDKYVPLWKLTFEKLHPI